MLARNMGGYWLKNRDSELFQNSKRDNREEGFSKLDGVIKEVLHWDKFGKACTEKIEATQGKIEEHVHKA